MEDPVACGLRKPTYPDAVASVPVPTRLTNPEALQEVAAATLALPARARLRAPELKDTRSSLRHPAHPTLPTCDRSWRAPLCTPKGFDITESTTCEKERYIT